MRHPETLAREARWQHTWQQHDCFRAPATPTGVKFFNYDSGPFLNGTLHLGHVRTYVLGDVMARYQRLLGKCVLYATDLDAFGLPNELAAQASGVAPAELIANATESMTRELRALGISYDWSRVRRSCDPGYYRWTQWLFLELYHDGLIEYRVADAMWCDRCATSLARMQVEHGACWRCGGRVTTRSLRQWYVLLSRYSQELKTSLASLAHWSETAKDLLRSYLDEEDNAEHSPRARRHDWLVSRQRAWGTPIPIVHCDSCGPVAVPHDQLPVRLPDDLDWSLGARALAAAARFSATRCPHCHGVARRETDTLDCFFDGLWCWLACLTSLDSPLPFTRAGLAPWLPLDCFHSGLDTFVYLHLMRFLVRFLHARGIVDDAEMIRGHVGHAMVLANGRKMSKHLRNVISAHEVLDEFGADTVRVAILAAAGPQRPLSWQRSAALEAEAFLGRVTRFTQACVDATPVASQTAPSRAARALAVRVGRAIADTAEFLASYRPHAALHALQRCLADLEGFALHRMASHRMLSSDAALLNELVAAFLIALSPCAPHITEELWARLGESGLVCQARWPDDSARSTAIE